MEKQEKLHALWALIKEELLKRINFTPSIWEGISVSVPITIEGEQFVVGYPSEQASVSSGITAVSTRQLIEKILAELLKRPLKCTVIEGTTISDWERHKEQQALRARLVQQGARPAPSPTPHAAEPGLQALAQEMAQQFHSLPNRQLQQTKARFILEWARRIAEFEHERLRDDQGSEEATVREVERLIQRIAVMTGAPAELVALEIERARRQLG